MNLPPGERERQLADEAAARVGAARRAAAQDELPPTSETVGAVVVTFNDEPHLALTLRRLQREAADVVVCDLSSKDRSREVAAEHVGWAKVHDLSLEAGFGAAVNEGARLLRQPVLLVLHGDARLRPGALQQIAGQLAARGGKVGCCGPRIVAPHGEVEYSAGFRPTPWRRLRAVVAANVRRPRILRPPRRQKRYAWCAPAALADVDWVSGVAMALRREAFDAVGGFDERFFLAEGDVDLCLRLRRAGWRVLYDPRARAIHLDRVKEAAGSRVAARRRLGYKHGLIGRLSGRAHRRA